jgi:hypothetical protein
VWGSSDLTDVTARGPNPDSVWKRGRQLAGIIDSALSSFATFVIGVYAVRELNSEALATYAIAFSAIFLLGSFHRVSSSCRTRRRWSSFHLS